MEAIAGWPVPPEEWCGRVAEPRLAYENRPLPAIFVTIRPPPIASRSMGHPRCAMNEAPKLCHHSVTIWLAARYICTIRMVSMYSWARIVTQSLRPKARYETPRANRMKPACSVPAAPQL